MTACVYVCVCVCECVCVRVWDGLNTTVCVCRCVHTCHLVHWMCPIYDLLSNLLTYVAEANN